MNYKKILAIVFIGMLSLSQASAEEAPQAVHDLVPSIQAWGQDQALVTAVQAQNASGASLDDIKKQDAEWIATTGVNAFMESLMSNAAAQRLKQLETTKPYFTEIFLMDNQGANVAMTNKTSDYWQGDEAKFTKSFNGGQGAVHVGEVKFDESAQAYLVQVSVPVMDGGAAIGAMTVGINLDQLEGAN